MDMFGAASHEEVLQLVVQVGVLLFAARLLGGLAQRIDQPSVVGEILAGVVLGPSLLSGLFPWIGELILPQTAVQGHLLEVVTLIGVMLLLIVTGMETDLGLIRRKAGVALGVAAGGLLLPFASGLALGYLIPDDLLADPGQRTVFALFVATALSISAIPVLARVLIDLDLMRRNIGQTLLAAGMIDDITGWTLLGLVTALAGAGALTADTVLGTVVSVVVFLVVTATLGAWMVDRSIRLVQDRFRGQDRLLTLVVALAFAWGAFTQWLELEPVLGAFAIGILFGRSPRITADTIAKLEAMALAVFAPIFFAVAGLRIDLPAILEPRLILLTLVVILVATFGKVVGAYIGARALSRQDHWSALAYGSGLNARGALGIIIATIGLSLGILSQEVFSIIVVMSVVTSLMAPMALRLTVARIRPDPEEQQRLRVEAAVQGSFVGEIRRVLVPVRPQAADSDDTRRLQVLIIDRLAGLKDMAITLFAVAGPDGRQEAGAYLTRLETMFAKEVNTRVVTAEDAVEAILAEAEADYDLMVLGSPTVASGDDGLFGPTIDDLVKLSPCPTLLVRGAAQDPSWEPKRILVPTNGTRASRRAAELATAIAAEDGSVEGIHIVSETALRTRRDLAEDITSELEQVAGALGRYSRTLIRNHDSVEVGILEHVSRAKPDLVVLGTEVRAGTTRLHLGPRVEHLVRHAPCPVVVVNG